MKAYAPVAVAHEPLPERADYVIVGGGIMGLATAYELARPQTQTTWSA